MTKTYCTAAAFQSRARKMAEESARLDLIAAQREIVRQHRATCDVCLGGGDCWGTWGVEVGR